ncbi:MAG: NAD-dependent epimerase/dehydratase family protein [Rhodospirillaceae bacterium]|jgi:UDP-glucuronate 4-epimerase|nr:NAD-dependent epimerase/dehydratase family protein [Rhodospirillaceae bacterium]MBT4486249.1 NAD-dependent epimerase/dehydratase family protein [Rhodospirillaceae bacterium]MBT5191770.1 NAD-dependent epimerase/dehydratase family protein [Rhodospirillaceae bacterium]MBT5895328.1 NAD-dependent epimerase/dehydratase family protein [Rhodospirillaceae bacterium]MBT6428562.1 NAD-dependent epimerase/dehydratase family protein [Rhodospirillaceae bacterium]
MTVLLTGAAGFIGFHTAQRLLAQGERVVGVDNLNPYYSPALKDDRLRQLVVHPNFTFHQINIADRIAMEEAVGGLKLTSIIHLAAQAGVRHSIENPFAYVEANLIGHMVILELARRQTALDHMVYASSSSVYGGNTKLPFSETDRVDHPVSLYAATKKADELLSQSYAHLYGIPQTGLRFFTVYGPWGRPDMALWLFTEAILAGRPIKVFNHGDMRRDFTYVDDIVTGILAARDKPPKKSDATTAPHRVFNIGNNHPEALLRLIALLEDALGKKAERILEPMQPGDVKETYADLTAIDRDLGFHPTTTIDDGIPKFVAWYRDYHNL